MAFDAATLSEIVEKDDLHVAPFRNDEKTPGTPTLVWSVAVDGELYARAYSGIKSTWYQAAIEQKAGQVTSIGRTFDVTFAPVHGSINDKIDAAYREKYTTDSYVPAMISEQAQAATVRISPRK